MNDLPDQPETPVDSIKLHEAVLVLQRLCDSPDACLVPESAASDVAKLASTLVRRLKKCRREHVKERDKDQLAKSAIRQKREEKQEGRYLASDIELAAKDTTIQTLGVQRRCYVCKQPFRHVHRFYDAMCLNCGDENFAKRQLTADLAERSAVVTGGRVKIGFQIALKLLRAGADVHVTTRFPHDAAHRYQQEEDFDEWSDRLHVYHGDFRSLHSIDALSRALAADCPRLNILINNAAQTIRRPREYFRHQLEREQQLAKLKSDEATQVRLEACPEADGFQTSLLVTHSISSGATPLPGSSSEFPQALERLQMGATTAARPASDPNFPTGLLDKDGQQVDLRHKNSWTMPLEGVSTDELLEVHAVNSLAPFLLIQKLKPLLLASEQPNRYIVNVTAMEGHFASDKQGRHPHTNMAKAGMNMITRTCADAFAEDGIYMNSVDTGWVTNEFPHAATEAMRVEMGFEPPLDEIDGAARVLDPIWLGVTEQCQHVGQFLKDYQSQPW